MFSTSSELSAVKTEKQSKQAETKPKSFFIYSPTCAITGIFNHFSESISLNIKSGKCAWFA
ncbi:MAG: gallidermin family lantibiotic, partial [Spirochaetaceae bacterium]|nr:gallidermin family lantibiotic [Spirochaetaceae bacterium]